MLIAEEFLLLAFDDATGLPLLSGDRLEPALGGAVLAELALAERVGVTSDAEGWLRRGRLTVVATTPTDDAILDTALRLLAANEGRKVKDLVSSMSSRRVSKGLRDALLTRLAGAGVLDPRQGTVLGLIPRTTWPTRDPRPEAEVRHRLDAALLSGTAPTERTVVLIGLLHATGLLPKVVAAPDRSALRERARALTAGDWVARAVKQAIDEVNAVVLTAGTAGVVGGSS